MKGLIFYDTSPPIPALFYPPFHILQQWLPLVSAHKLEINPPPPSVIGGLIYSVNYSHVNNGTVSRASIDFGVTNGHMCV